MSSKAKKARRKAYAQYLTELKKVESGGDRISRLDTSNSARKLQNTYGPEVVSGQTRLNSRKADSVGRKINAGRAEFNAGLDNYNEKVSLLKRRLAGEDVTAELAEKKAPLKAKISELDDRLAEIRAAKTTQAQPVLGLAQKKAKLNSPDPEVLALREEKRAVQNKLKGYGNHQWSGAAIPASSGGNRRLAQITDAYTTVAWAALEAQGKMRRQAPLPAEEPEPQGYGHGLLSLTGGGASKTPSMGNPTGNALNEVKTPSMATAGGASFGPNFDDPSTAVDNPNSTVSKTKELVGMYGALADKISKQVLTGAKRRVLTGGRSPASGLLSSTLVGGNQTDMIRAGLA